MSSMQTGASVVALLLDTTEMQVDSQELSHVDARAIVELWSPLLCCTRQEKLSPGKGQPMIKLKSSRESVTPPAPEVFNEEGEEEKDEEEEEEPVRPTKQQQTSSSTPKGKGKAKAKANTPTPSANPRQAQEGRAARLR
ncbi:hypothetical protein B0H14DRAFT_2572727 [Mycena olivaceomarginata]|nr:hypothetical protein B0H14DRAFT_2572727 [Mycena olivaceomarginata]